MTDLVVETPMNKDPLYSEDIFVKSLMTFTADRGLCTAAFGDTLRDAIRNNVLAVRMGIALTERLLLWSEPSPVMLVKLKAILIANIPVVKDKVIQQKAIITDRMNNLMSSEEWATEYVTNFLDSRNYHLHEPIFSPVEIDH